MEGFHRMKKRKLIITVLILVILLLIGYTTIRFGFLKESIIEKKSTEGFFAVTNQIGVDVDSSVDGDTLKINYIPNTGEFRTSILLYNDVRDNSGGACCHSKDVMDSLAYPSQGDEFSCSPLVLINQEICNNLNELQCNKLLEKDKEYTLEIFGATRNSDDAEGSVCSGGYDFGNAFHKFGETVFTVKPRPCNFDVNCEEDEICEEHVCVDGIREELSCLTVNDCNKGELCLNNDCILPECEDFSQECLDYKDGIFNKDKIRCDYTIIKSDSLTCQELFSIADIIIYSIGITILTFLIVVLVRKK